MKKLIEYLTKSIVDHPEEVKVEESESEDQVILKLSVHPDDIGRVIGKGGKIIRALRSLTYILAMKRKKRLILELQENQGKEKRSSLPVAAGNKLGSKVCS